MTKKLHIYMYDIYLIYKNITLVNSVANAENWSIRTRQGQKGAGRKNVYPQRIGCLFSDSDFLITEPDFF
jgi:hypothetical protein